MKSNHCDLLCLHSRRGICPFKKQKLIVFKNLYKGVTVRDVCICACAHYLHKNPPPNLIPRKVYICLSTYCIGLGSLYQSVTDRRRERTDWWWTLNWLSRFHFFSHSHTIQERKDLMKGHMPLCLSVCLSFPRTSALYLSIFFFLSLQSLCLGIW